MHITTGRILCRFRHEANIFDAPIALIVVVVVLSILIDYFRQLLFLPVSCRRVARTFLYRFQILAASCRRELIFQGGIKFCRF